jgi:GNAT superfamily N-acetyltransferase
MEIEVTTWHLEMLDPSWLRPAQGRGRNVAAAGEGEGEPPAAAALAVLRAEIPSPELSRFLYTAVGGDWWWTNRLSWTYDRWLAHLDRPALQTWVGYVAGTPVGYFELERQPRPAPEVGAERVPGADVEVVQFGLLPAFVGRGLGGAMLTAAAQRAWAMPAAGDEPGGAVRRVWLHTCTLDSPPALANYQARGFRVFRTETRVKTFPEATPGPWPGARARPE